MKEQFELNRELDDAWNEGVYTAMQFTIREFIKPISEIITSIQYEELCESAFNTLLDKFDRLHKR